MTGYGRGHAADGDLAVTVEVRSVNNRFKDVQTRLPREHAALEPGITGAVKKRFARGRFDIYVRRAASSGGASVRVDVAAASRLRAELSALAGELGEEAPALDLLALAALPGVLVPFEPTVDADGEWPLVELALGAALEQLEAMRRKEGAALHDDLVGHVDVLAGVVAKIGLEARSLPDRVKERLDERLSRLAGDRVDPWRLAQEVAVLADKADISEELARLKSHVAQFRKAVASDEAVGRRLDFLIQEMNREVNTIGSKAADSAVSALVVDCKSVIERMREQVANVE